MNIYSITPLYNRVTGKLEGEAMKSHCGVICDGCGYEIDDQSDNMPWTGFSIETLHDSEEYYHEERIIFTAKESKELFEINEAIELDNYELFEQNPYTYCRDTCCVRPILTAALEDEDCDIANVMLKRRMEIVRRLLITKKFTAAQLGLSIDH